MLEPMAVAVHAMRRVQIGAEDKVAVCGLGTIGLLLVMFLREAGVKNLFVIGNKDCQREAAERLGLAEDQYCDVLDRLAGGKIAPAGLISHWLSLENLNRGPEIMRDKTEEYVKVMGIFFSDTV